MILTAVAAKLRRRSKDDFKGRHFEAALILQAVSWYLRYPLSYRDIEELLERSLEVDHSTLNRWVLAYAPLIERRLRRFRKPHCGSVRVPSASPDRASRDQSPRAGRTRGGPHPIIGAGEAQNPRGPAVGLREGIGQERVPGCSPRKVEGQLSGVGLAGDPPDAAMVAGGMARVLRVERQDALVKLAEHIGAALRLLPAPRPRSPSHRPRRAWRARRWP
jgi:hypothetical protein